MPREEESGGGGWLIIGLIVLGLVFWISRAGPHVYPWNEPGYGSNSGGDSGAGGGGGTYASQANQYAPGSYGAFWENEGRAQRGEPVVASPGFAFDPAQIKRIEVQLQAQQELKKQQEEAEQLRREIDQLKRESDALRRERTRNGF